ncbi:MAG: alkaline phosphatase synthesis transcriptional regulatory proteinphoP [Ignavibacteria bacterium]|nr:alkaline phosphatase synthesis transcriptional regulatory proteinphoP [Ignavibacteria bacterium]
MEQKLNQRKIFILEDEEDIAHLVTLNLHKEGFKTKEFTKAESFFKHLKEEIPGLLILDLMLPDLDGLEVCKKLRQDKKYSQIPIIMLTAKSEEFDKVLGLELGADDYMTKPFSPRELVARVKSILRRETRADKSYLIKVGEILSIDLQKYEVIAYNVKVELTSTEFKILTLLLERRGWVYSRNQILDYLDTYDKGVLDRTVDVHIKNLREKLGDAGKMIKNIRGVGYKFEETDN